MRLQPFISNNSAQKQELAVDPGVKANEPVLIHAAGSDTDTATLEPPNTGSMNLNRQVSGLDASEPPDNQTVTHQQPDHSTHAQYTTDHGVVDYALELEQDFGQFDKNLSNSISTNDVSAFEDYALMMQDTYLTGRPCSQCRQAFIDILKNPAADLVFRVLSMDALSNLADYESSQEIVNEFVSQLMKANQSEIDHDAVSLIHELKRTLLESDDGINFKALVDYYIGKADASIDYPLSVLDPTSRSSIELEISSMLSDHYNRELVAEILRDSFDENPDDHAQSQLIKLNYPELFVELANAAQRAGLMSEKEYYIDHIYQNLTPDEALRGILELSSRNLVPPENLYQRTFEWAQRNPGAYNETYGELFSNYHDQSDRSIKSVAIALTGNLYDENKAKSILNDALAIETDPFIRKMISDELSRLNDTGIRLSRFKNSISLWFSSSISFTQNK